MRRLDQPDGRRDLSGGGHQGTATTDHFINTEDGRELALTTIGGTSDDTVVVAGGVAIRRGFYRNFATWLAARGPTVITFDYRDVGGSRTMPLRASPARMADWGRHDIDAVLRHAASHTSGRLLYVGHSAGGQLLGLAPSADRIDRIVTVATQNGYWRTARPPERYRLWALWHLVFPAAVRSTGYLPGRWLGLGSDLPPGIAGDWIRWCRDPDYLFGDPQIDPASYRHVYAPIRAHHITDDPWASRSAVAAMHRRYARCPVDFITTTPEPGTTIGHSGLFRTSTGADHWPALASWLLDRP
jgi:predicted alpha/beta hydrolase